MTENILITKIEMIGESFESLLQYYCIVHENSDDKEMGNIIAFVIVSIGSAIIYRHNNNYTPETILKDVPKIFKRYKLYDCELILEGSE